MTKIKCMYCGKVIDDKLKKCPKCHNLLNKGKFGRVCLYLLWLLVQCFLSFVLYNFSKESFYSESISDLYVLLFIGGVILVNSLVGGVVITKIKKEKGFGVLVSVIAVLFACYALFVGGRVIKAFKYDNSGELLMLANEYKLNVAKTIKNELEDIFEYDEDKVFSRDIVISNFYTDGNFSNLYIEDSYGNYKLKFLVNMDNLNIRDIFWDAMTRWSGKIG